MKLAILLLLLAGPALAQEAPPQPPSPGRDLSDKFNRHVIEWSDCSYTLYDDRDPSAPVGMSLSFPDKKCDEVRALSVFNAHAPATPK